MNRHTGPRGRTVPVPAWWLDEVKALMAGRMTQPQLGELAKEQGARGVSQSTISRALGGGPASLDVLEGISAVLEIPCPVIIFSSRIEAQRYLADRASGSIKHAKAKAGDIATGVADLAARRQAGGVEPEHAIRDSPPTSLGRRRPAPRNR